MSQEARFRLVLGCSVVALLSAGYLVFEFAVARPMIANACASVTHTVERFNACYEEAIK